ncbi:MAG: DUF4252 domain-containing protein [Tannerella sp.]|jgi:hypothetical protein|nr:DUF4252 domain-containing protein [Tannerella sp.]
MKRIRTSIFALGLLLCTASTCLGQEKLFDKYAGMDKVSSVYISKNMFNMMPALGDIGLALTNMKGKIESLQVLSTERADQIPQMRKDFSSLVKSDMQELMRVRDGASRTTFYAEMDGDKVKNLLMLADTDSSYTVVQVKGDFTLQDVQKMGESVEGK